MIKYNSRYRGPSEIHKYGNYINETIHDLKLLGSILDRNEIVEDGRGQSDFIYDNFIDYMNGMQAPLTSSITSSSILDKKGKDLYNDLDFGGDTWVIYGNATKSIDNGIVTLTSPGTLDPAGMQRVTGVESGDIIYVRVGVQLVSGDGSAFSIGSHDINSNEGAIKKVALPVNGDTIYVDNRLYCRYRESIHINIDIHNTPSQLNPAVIKITSCEIKYLYENPVQLTPPHDNLLTSLNNLSDRINDLKFYL